MLLGVSHFVERRRLQVAADPERNGPYRLRSISECGRLACDLSSWRGSAFRT